MDIIVMVVVIVITFVLGFKRGYEFRQYRESEEERKNISSAIDKLEKDFFESLIRVKIEKVDGMLFVYNQDTNEFMAQGKNEDELADILKKRYPGKRFAAPENNLKEVGLPHE